MRYVKDFLLFPNLCKTVNDVPLLSRTIIFTQNQSVWVEPMRWCYWVCISGWSGLQPWERISCFKHFKKNQTGSIHDVHSFVVWNCYLNVFILSVLPQNQLCVCKVTFLSPSSKKPLSYAVSFSSSSPLPPLSNKYSMNRTWPICRDLRIQPSFHLFLLQKMGVWMNYCNLCSFINLFDIHHLFCIQGWNEFSLLWWAVKIMYFCLIESLKETKQMLFCPVCLLKVQHVAKPLWAVGLAKTTACSREKTMYWMLIHHSICRRS